MRLFLLAVIAGFVFAPLLALAEDGPCRSENGNVVCPKPSFDKLMGKCIDADKGSKTCAIRLAAVEQTAQDTQKALDECLARPLPPPPPKPSALRPVGAVVAGVVGGALIVSSVVLDIGAGGRVAGAGVGLLLIGGGVVLAIP